MPEKVSATLKAIHELREAVERLRHEHGARLDALGDRLDALGTRVVEGELRTTTAILDLHGTLRDVRDLLAGRAVDRERLDDHERRLTKLERAAG